MRANLAHIVSTLLLITVSLALAVPTQPPPCGLCNYDFDASFDDLATSIITVGSGPAVPTPYKNLDFQGLFVAGAGLVPGLTFQTPPNAAAHGQIRDLLGDPLVLNSQYPGSKVRSFDLRGFWFGCKSTSGGLGLAGVAVACSLAVTGYKQDPQRPELCEIVGVGFNPSTQGATLGILNAALSPAAFGPEWAGLTNVTIGVSSSALPAGSVVNSTTIFMDNVLYQTHEVCCK